MISFFADYIKFSAFVIFILMPTIALMIVVSFWIWSNLIGLLLGG